MLIEGPRGSGKTATGRQHAASEALLDTDENARMLASLEPSAILDGSTPRLLDEWQLEPRLWNHVRRAVDDRQEVGQFILTGSATPTDDSLDHSGAARILRLRMRTLTLAEAGHSTAQVSLANLLTGERLSASRGDIVPSLRDLIEIVCRGGWPAMRKLGLRDAMRLLRSYLDDVARIDLPKLEGHSRRDTGLVRRTLISLARHVSTEVAYATVAKDVSEPGAPVRPQTISEYVSLLERVFVIERQPSWGPHLRSRDTVRLSPRMHFVDPALAAAGMGASPDRLFADLKTFGQLFESLVVRDLRVYAQVADARVSHYRDSGGAEVDAIVTAPDGSWLAAEVKLGQGQVDAAAESLLAFSEKLDHTRTPGLAGLMVITTGEYAYTREDGVRVVPLTMLGP